MFLIKPKLGKTNVYEFKIRIVLYNHYNLEELSKQSFQTWFQRHGNSKFLAVYQSLIILFNPQCQQKEVIYTQSR